MTLPYGGRSLAALACLAALAGCGSEDAAPEAVASSSTSTSAEATTSVQPDASPAPTEDSSPAGPVRLDPDQVAELVAAALDDSMGARVVLDNGLGLLSGVGVADFRDTPTAVAATLSSTETGDEQKVEVRVVDDVLYVADAQRWLSVGVDSPANPFGSSLSDQLDPRTVLDTIVDQLTAATRRTGSSTADDGEPLTTYRLMADGPGVAAVLAPELSEQPDAVVPATVTCDLSVDDQGLARSIVVDLGDDNGQLAYTLAGWGTGPDVTVTAPPAAQVDDLPNLNGS